MDILSGQFRTTTGVTYNINNGSVHLSVPLGNVTLLAHLKWNAAIIDAMNSTRALWGQVLTFIQCTADWLKVQEEGSLTLQQALPW